MKLIILLIAVIYPFQYFNAQSINPDITSKPWNAKWIDVPNTSQHGYGIYHFRKEIVLNEKPSQFIIHVSADNRY